MASQKSRKNHRPPVPRCQNCDTLTPGNFCPECGQDAREHRVALRLLIVGLWNDLFTFDNRFWRSMVRLLIRPGALTLDYVAGQRVRYIPPARMYLFVSIVFFFLLSILARTNDDDSMGGRGAAADLQDGWAAVDDESVDLESDSDSDTAHGTVFGHDFEANEQHLVNAMLNLAPKVMFLLLPMFAALLALIYRRSKRLYVEHLIFSLHYHTVVFILYSVVILWSPPLLQLLVWLSANVYLYVALKRVYGQGWGKTVVKHILLSWSYGFVLTMFLAATAAGGIWLAILAEEHPHWLRWMV